MDCEREKVLAELRELFPGEGSCVHVEQAYWTSDAGGRTEIILNKCDPPEVTVGVGSTLAEAMTATREYAKPRRLNKSARTPDGGNHE